MGKEIYPPSVQPGLPKLNYCPSGWRTAKFGDLLNEVNRPVKLVDDKEYQLVVAKRSRGGIVARERLRGFKIKTPTQFETRSQDFLISNRQIVHGACGIVPESLNGSIVSNEYTVLHPTNDIDLDFFNYLSHTIYFQQTCFHSSVGVDVEKMIFRINEWFRYKINLPPLPEQKKIAEILAVWDRGIESLEKILKYYWKFSGKLKKYLFDEGNLENISEEITKGPIGDLCKTYAGGTPSTKNQTYWQNGDVPWMSSGEVNNREIFSVEGRITQVGLKESSAKLVPPNSVLIALAGQGKTRGKVAINRIELSTNQSLACAVPDSTVLDSGYLFHFLDNKYEELRQISDAGGGRGGLNLNLINSFLVQYPCDLSLQKKLSNLFFTIEAQAIKLSKLRLKLACQKQGLMQKLLTGKIRVKI